MLEVNRFGRKYLAQEGDVNRARAIGEAAVLPARPS